MNGNLKKKENNNQESPHIAICRSLHLIFDNAIKFKNASVENLPNVVYYDELGKRIDWQDLQNQPKAFVLPGMVEKTSRVQTSNSCIEKLDLELAKNVGQSN